jgi:hypothetical protein
MYNKFGGFGGSADSSSDVLNCISDAFCVNPVMYYVKGYIHLETSAYISVHKSVPRR